MKIRLQHSFSYKNILANVVIVLTILRSGECFTVDEDCRRASSLGDARRTTTQDPGTCGGICDNNIREVSWYRLDESNSGARMPESFVEVWHCGTYIPIWLNGAHPTADYPGPVEIPVCAQLRVGGPTCEWRSQITVKRCDDGVEYFVYRLKATPFCDMAYCAGNGINCENGGSWNDISKSCTITPTPPLNANPTLVGPYIKPSDTKVVTDDTGKAFTATKFSMKCTITYTQQTSDDGARYDVIFESNGQVVYRQTLRSTDSPVVEMSETYLVGRVGQNVSCKVTSYWQSQFPKRSPYRGSNYFIFDIYFVDGSNNRRNSLTIEESRPMKIKVKTSFMITTPWCFNLPAGSPCFPYYTFRLSSTSLLVSVCTFRLANDTLTSGDIWVSSVPDVSPAFGKGGSISFQTENSDQGQNSIFGSYTSDKLSVIISDPTPWPLCDSWGDPHIKTFDTGYYYHTYLTGDFVLLEVPSKDIEVHVKLYPCAAPYTCNCGVIAREGNNVLGINTCGSSTLVERYLYDETNPGGTIRYQGGNRWIITLPSGLRITVDVYGGVFMNIGVQGNGVDTYQGLCKYSHPSQCEGCQCTTECDTAFRVTGSDSLFSYSRNNPPPCLKTNPPIVPQCECDNGASPNRICTMPDNNDLSPSTQDNSKCKPLSSRLKRQSNTYSEKPKSHQASEQSSPNIQWPTKSNITEKDALKVCNSNISLSGVYDLCVNQIHVNVTQIIQLCVLDIQISDDINFSPKFVATQMELTCKWTIDKADNDTGKLWRQQYVDKVCPRQCNQNGICSNGQCVCSKGYMNDDCSVPEGQVPEIQSLVSATCDVRAPELGCPKVQLHAIRVSSDHLVCQFKDATKVISLDMSPSVSGGLVTCNVPLVPVTPDIAFSETVTNYAVYVSISNSATSMKFSNEMKFTIYDGLCVSCDGSSGCKNKQTACNILGRCYEANAVMFCGKNSTDPRMCVPTVSNTKWLPPNYSDESKGSTTCSSSRPSAAAAILLFSYIFIKLVKDNYVQPK